MRTDNNQLARPTETHLDISSIALVSDPFSVYLADKDVLDVLRALDAWQLFYPLEEAYRYTRYYEQGLCVADSLLATCEELRQFITEEEWNRWIPHLTRLKLVMLDYLNSWAAYIQCYEKITADFDEGRLDDQWRYLLSENRYELIKRKYKKQMLGSKLGNQLRHQQDQLSQEEIDKRFKRILQLLKRSADYPGIGFW